MVSLQNYIILFLINNKSDEIQIRSGRWGLMLVFQSSRILQAGVRAGKESKTL